MWSLSFALLWAFLHFPSSHSIINRPPSPSYLNQQRPLWILEDQVAPQDYSPFAYSTHKPLYSPPLPPQRSQRPIHSTMSRPQPSSSYYKLPRRLQLPNHYLHWQPGLRPTRRSRQQQPLIPIRRREQHYLPIFDSLPGAESEQPAALFIYSGPKGELILNTMLSARKYPMQEPVPGQVLYPPNVPIFRPKPIIERFRKPMARNGMEAAQMNLTLIPFYEHEAISAPTVGTTKQPAVIYEATKAENSKQRRAKKAKHYAAYHSPNDVQWQPPQLTTRAPTTPFPLTLASPLQNHRQWDELRETTTQAYSDPEDYELVGETTTEGVSEEHQQEEPFRIVYVEESLEKPTKATKPPLMSSRYAVAKEYYAFPVYTLGRLLKPEEEKQSNMLDDLSNGRPQKEEELNNKTKEDQDNVDTWFILNSRYKGHHKHQQDFRLSSRYAHTATPETKSTEF